MTTPPRTLPFRSLRLGAEFTHVASVEVPTFVKIDVNDAAVEIMSSAWSSMPDMPRHGFDDQLGNRGYRITLPAGESVFTYSATVRVADAVDEQDASARQHPIEELPDAVLPFLLPSRYCQSDVLSNDAARLFGATPRDERTLQRVLDVQDWVWHHLDYRTGSTGSWWTAVDAFNSGYGICRDFAHTMVALCRALNLPSRYVSGYLPDMDVPPDPAPMDFHAWCEVFLDGRWWTFDPRHNAARKGHVVISRGRDAADCALTTTFGSPWLKRMVVMCEEEAVPLAA